MFVFITICFVSFVTSVVVFDFEKSKQSDNISFVNIFNQDRKPLPSWFIVCSSHKVGRFDGMSPYQIIGKNGTPWFSFTLHQDKDNFYMYGHFTRNHMLLAIIDAEPKMYFWYHICVEIDTKLSLISIAINGDKIANNIENKKISGESRPPYIDGFINLGKWKSPKEPTEKQFYWTITNIQIFSGGQNKSNISASPCSFVGDVFSWHNLSWTLHGEGVQYQDLDPEKVCFGGFQRDLAIPVNMNQVQAITTCHKLGHSALTVALDVEQLAAFTKDFLEKTGEQKQCYFVHSPYSDKEKEGYFVNLEDDIPLNYSAWSEGQPNGFQLESSAQIKLNTKDVKKSYWDRSETKEACFSCSLTKLLTIHMLGSCHWTMLDIQYFPIEHKTNGILFSGIKASEIR